MRNLKRVLSLALAAMMLIGMMVVGAGAVDAKDFTDYDEIQNTEAVSVMNLLNIIVGKEDGSYFDPSAPVTRGEMAKMITVIMNGGKDPVLGTKDTPTFSDIDNHWAEAYIEYCGNQGIIAGRGDGTFDPNGNVTGTEAAKMMLVAMGYNAAVFGLEGNNWAITTNALANNPECDLYNGIEDVDPYADINRDDVAQLIYNALQGYVMIRSWSQNQTDGTVTEMYSLADGKHNVGLQTLLSQKYSTHIYEGVLGATGNYGTTLGEYKNGLRVNVEKTDGSLLTNGAGVATPAAMAFEYKDQDLTALMGQYVKVLYNGDKDICYGVYPVDGMNTVVTTDVTKVSYPTGTTSRVQIDGTTYDLDTNFNAGIYYGEANTGRRTDTYNETGDSRADYVTFIDNDGDEMFDMALVTPITVAKIDYMGTTTLTMTNQASTFAPSTLSPQLYDIIYDDDLAKGDYAIVSRNYYADKDQLVKVDVTTGTVSGVKGTAPNYTDYQVDGTWMAPANGYPVPSIVKSNSEIDYVAVNGKIFFAKQTAGSQGSEDVALIYQLAGSQDDFTSTSLTAKIVLADGTKETVTVDGLYNTVADANAGTPNQNDGDEAVDAAEEAFIGMLLTYEINNDGEYSFTKLHNTGDGNTAGYDSVNLNATVTTDSKDNTLGGKVVADDAIIILFSGNVNDASANTNAVKVISGREFKSLNNTGNLVFAANSATDINTTLIGKDADNFSRVMMASVTVSDGVYTAATGKWNLSIVSNANFGYLVDKSWTDVIDGEKYNGYKLWNGTETITVYEKDNTPANLPARTIIAYDVVDGTTIKNVTAYSNRGAVWAYAEGSKVTINGTEYEITSDTVILNIDDENKAGVEGTSVPVARELGENTNQFYENCYYIVSNDKVIALVMDVTKNELSGATVMTPPVSVSTTAASGNGKGGVGSVSVPSVNTTVTLKGELTGTTDFATDAAGVSAATDFGNVTATAGANKLTYLNLSIDSKWMAAGGTATVTQVNKAMNAAYGAGTFANDTKTKANYTADDLADFNVLLMNGEDVTLTITFNTHNDSDEDANLTDNVTVVYTIDNGVAIQ